ncbi:hypothetical protein JTB14_034074 [Gonioctena quinquepunctata]|nr:hypothetical protein JTB14_034074 [Gonioctena quinquepunctata]
MKLVKVNDAQEAVYYLAKDGILYRVENYGNKLIVPRTFISKVMGDFHDSPMAGHPRQEKTLIKNQITTEQIIEVSAVTSTKNVYLCQLEFWQTHHARILVIEEEQKNHISPQVNTPPHNADLMAYVNSKFLHIERAYTRKLDQLYTDTVHRRCSYTERNSADPSTDGAIL